MDPERGVLGTIQGQPAKFRGIHLGDVKEAGAEILHVRSPERAFAVQLDVVRNDHNVPWAVVRIDGPGGIGEDYGLYPQQFQDTDGNHQLLEAVPLVGVKTAGHADHPFARHCAEDQFPGVGGHGREQKVGDVGVVYNNRMFDGLGKRP